MQKEKVIIWGTGRGYYKRADILKNKFDILAFTDNGQNKEMVEGYPYICPDKMDTFEFQKIIVCSIKYFNTIKYQLIMDYHIEEEKIICIKDITDCIFTNWNEEEKIIFDSVKEYESINTNKDLAISHKEMWLICNEYNAEAGTIPEHYFVQDIWGAKKIHERMPKHHYDIGSRVDGFLGHLLVFLDEVNYIDIRPLPDKINGLNFIQGDATNLENFENDSIESLSSFHAVEHFGLGRYGDPIDPEACFKAMNAFQRVLKPGGYLYFGIPLGPQNKVIFNAQRFFKPSTIIEQFSKLELLDFDIIRGNESNYSKVKIKDIEIIEKGIPENSCGLFVFRKN
ncbi:MAG: DUF268 domain-containing protein [Lachnospiraceae bacterium]|nr:DUF268 domain-containing protein [Lachnospiraceae bacterium]